MSANPLSMPVQFVKGVGPYLSGLLEKKGIKSVRDLFYHFPIRYLDRRQIVPIRKLSPGKERCILAEIVGGSSRHVGRRKIYELLVRDESALAVVVWFHFNEKYVKSKYPPGKQILIFGECQFFGAKKQFVHPEIEEWEDDDTDRARTLIPIYSLTEGIHQKTIRRVIFYALEHYLSFVCDNPITVRAGDVRIGLREAIEKIHSPPLDVDLGLLQNQSSPFHQRVIYDELFFLQLGLGLRKMGIKKEAGNPFTKKSTLTDRALKLLPFELTSAQKKVLSEIKNDVSKDEPMNRLLQGDVGCGKTLVAFLVSLAAYENGFQTAFMAPTEILAQQHYKNLKSLAEQMDVRSTLLTGSTPNGEREEVLTDLAEGKIHLVFGTHALIEEDVHFNQLGLVVIDEQHRFGVLQRAALKNKNNQRVPHVLVMTATPIPRTLSMHLYGDLDVSVIDELPQGRRPIITRVFHEKMRSVAFQLMEQELRKGRQTYVVCPLIEETEKSDLKNAISTAENLKKVFANYSVGLLHGRMKGSEKEEIMGRFKKNQINILVSTTVIEVGVDVPNSTVMVIEHAERFGLSQLHQLRGRVGRGGDQSYCLLMADYARSEEARFRLNVMEETNDGFKIAEEDLNLRGPGDFLGTRQSGLPDLKIAHLIRDSSLLQAARRRAFEILGEDPDLQKAEHQGLLEIVAERWGDKLNLARVS